VTFEGPDGAGKTTQLELLAESLREAGYDVVVTREPGGTDLGERIRALLLESGAGDMVPQAEALLMTAARAQHVAGVIRPALAAGKIVLCDRFVDSTLAYQGAGRGLSIDELEQLQVFATGNLTPDLTVLLDLPARAGLSRRRGSGAPLNRLDLDEVEFHERVRAWYVESAKRNPDRWVTVDAEQPREVIARIIEKCVLDMAPSGSVVSRRDGVGE
jgi:dTMP kinase